VTWLSSFYFPWPLGDRSGVLLVLLAYTGTLC
jgi:hypothetical protein